MSFYQRLPSRGYVAPEIVRSYVLPEPRQVEPLLTCPGCLAAHPTLDVVLVDGERVAGRWCSRNCLWKTAGRR